MELPEGITNMVADSIRIEDAELVLLFRKRNTNTAGDDVPSPIDPMHSHNFAELFSCTKGSILLRTEAGDVSLKAGDIAVIPCQIPHVKLSADNSDLSDWHSLNFLCFHRNYHNSKSVYQQLSKFCYGSSPFYIRQVPHLCFEIDRVVKQEITAALDITQTGMVQIASVLFQLLKLCPDLGQQDRMTRDANVNKNLYRTTQIEDILHYTLNTQYKENISEKEIAGKLHISQRQFKRFMRQQFGTTWHQAILRCRLEKAAQLLAENDSSIETICFECGFTGKTSFYKAFEKRYGVTPGQFRKQGKTAQ